MPGLKLNFLKNVNQVQATGRNIPSRQLEAIIVYGTPEQRAKVVESVLPQTYSLSINNSTYHIVMSIIKHCDNQVRARLLFELRRKITDMARNKIANTVLGAIIECVQSTQRREIAESFTLYTDEIESASRHVNAKHVIQKLLEYPSSYEAISRSLLPHINSLLIDPNGQHVVAKLIDTLKIENINDTGELGVIDAIFPGNNYESNIINMILTQTTENAVICSLIKSEAVSNELKKKIVEDVIKNIKILIDLSYLKKKKNSEERNTEIKELEPEFGNESSEKNGKNNNCSENTEGKHNHLLCAIFDNGLDINHQLFLSLEPFFLQMVKTKGQVQVISSIIKSNTVTSSQLNLIFNALRAPDLDSENKIDFSTSKLINSVDDINRNNEKKCTSHGSYENEASNSSPKSIKNKTKDSSSSALLEMSAIATHQWRSVILRSFIEARFNDFLNLSKKINANNNSFIDNFINNDVKSMPYHNTGSVVLQRFVEFCGQNYRDQVYKEIFSDVPNMTLHPIACYFIQVFIEVIADEDKRNAIGTKVLEGLGNLRTSLGTASGSHVLQKIAVYVDDSIFKRIVNKLLKLVKNDENQGNDDDNGVPSKLSGEEKKEKFDTIKHLSKKDRRDAFGKVVGGSLEHFALHPHACYAIRTLLTEAKRRQLENERKSLMNALKPHVFLLASSPWSGRIVLDTMLTCGSKELANSIRNVIFLKAEYWLTPKQNGSNNKNNGKRDKDNKRNRSVSGGGMDPTMRKALRGELGAKRSSLNSSHNVISNNDTINEKEIFNASNTSESVGAKLKKKKNAKIFRSIKK